MIVNTELSGKKSCQSSELVRTYSVFFFDKRDLKQQDGDKITSFGFVFERNNA